MRTTFSSVNQINNNNNKISFGTNPIYNVNLKKVSPDGVERLVQARFSELTHSKDDARLFASLGESCYNTAHYIDYISTWYNLRSRDFRFFVIETMEKFKRNEMFKNIKSVMQLTFPMHINNNRIRVDTLQTIPGSMQIKGSGELQIYGAAKIAQALNNEVVVHSLNDPFYKHIGMSKAHSGSFYLKPPEQEKFVQHIEKKYSFTP